MRDRGPETSTTGIADSRLDSRLDSPPPPGASAGVDDTIVDGEPTSRSDPASPRAELRRGDTVGRYVVIDEAGRGAMGIVYVAIDPDLERRVAVKVLRRGPTRLRDEARALARLSHPNVVGVYDVGESDGRLFIAMEYVDGVSVDQWLAERPRRLPEIVDVFIAAGRGLVAAHAAGLIHRDFKPANVMVGRDGSTKVTDFGLARAEHFEDGERPVLSTTDPADHTRTRGSIGTPAYMAPELHHAQVAGVAADQFSFCVALYQALYGEHPFGGSDALSIAAAVLSGKLREAPAGSVVPSRLRRVLVRGLRLDPQERHPSMEALVAQLVRVRAPSRRAWWIAAGVALSAAAGWAATRPPPPDPCAAVDDEIDEAWTIERAAELRAAFGRSTLPFAPRASDEAVERLDAYADRWRTLRHTACVEERTGDVAVARAAGLAAECLERARSDLRAVADVLVAGDDAAITVSTKLVYGLPPLDQCADPTLASAFPIPSDPEIRDAAARARAELSQLRAQRIASQPVDLPRLADLAKRGDELGFAPLQAEIAIERAYVALQTDQDEGVALLERALEAAVEGDADLLAAEATAHLLSIDGDQRGDDRRAGAWERLARGYLRRWPDRGRLRVMLQGALSLVLSRQGRFDEAVPLSLEVAELAETLDDPWRASIYRGNYGLVLTRAGRLDEAIDVLTAHVDHTVALYGPGHPEAAWAYNALGNVYLQLNDAESAQQWCSKAVETYRALGNAPLELAHSLNNLSNAHAEKQEMLLSRDYSLEALEALQRHTEGDHPTRATLLNNLGSNAAARGEPREAASYFREALEMERRLGSAPLQLLLPTANLAWSYQQSGDVEATRRQLAETVELLRRSVPDEHPLAGRVYRLVGGTYLAIDDVASAVEHLTTAERLLRKLLGPDAELTRETADDLAQARAKLPAEAR